MTLTKSQFMCTLLCRHGLLDQISHEIKQLIENQAVCGMWNA